jgi:hypothetical protein
MASSFLGRGPEIRDKSILTLPGKNNVKCTHGVHSYIPSWIPPPDELTISYQSRIGSSLDRLPQIAEPDSDTDISWLR